MEFTEVQELNNIAFHARSFVPGQALSIAAPLPTNYGSIPAQTPLPILMFDYEKALGDTPPASPSGSFVYQKPDALKILDRENEESIEDLLASIKNSIMEYSDINDLSTEPSQTHPPERQASVRVEEEPMMVIEKEEEQKPEDENRQHMNFEKITEDYVSKSYIETKNLKSFLSHSIKAFPMNNEYSSARRAEMKTFKVYFLTEKTNTLLPLSLGVPVSEVIKRCLETFKLSKTISSLIKYPDRPDAYQLQKDMLTGPLDRQRTLKDLKIGRELIVVESKEFDASKPYVELKGALDGKESTGNSLVTVTLHLPTEDKVKMIIQMGLERQLKDVFSRLALEGKVSSGYNMQNYNLRVYSSDPETRWKEAKNFLDLNMPLKNIKGHGEGIQLELVKKKFADEPNERPEDHRDSTSIKKNTVDLTNEHDDQIILYNEVSANHYEEFEVTKINENGKKQERILGIDGFKLYNYSRSYKQEQGGRIGEIFNNLFLSKFGTMNPERLFTDVMEAKLTGGKVFQIAVNSEGRTKWTWYEAGDIRTANQIVAKINYLKGIQAKKNI